MERPTKSAGIAQHEAPRRRGRFSTLIKSAATVTALSIGVSMTSESSAPQVHARQKPREVPELEGPAVLDSALQAQGVGEANRIIKFVTEVDRQERLNRLFEDITIQQVVQ